MERNNNFYAVQKWENDGVLALHNAKTLGKYAELQDRIYHLDTKSMGIFWAFSDKQYRESIDYLKANGLYKDGDKLYTSKTGGFGTKEAWDKYSQALDKITKEIAKCDPYEVYCYEYNNYECCIDWDGDERAVEAVLRIWDRSVVEEALKGRRFSAGKPVGMIAEEMYHN